MKKIVKILIMLFAMITFFNCSGGSDIKEADGTGGEQLGKDEIKGTPGNSKLLKFDFSNANAIASVERTNQSGRAAAGTDNSPLVSINSKGETKSVMISDKLNELPKIEFMTKAQTQNSEYVYIVFDNYKSSWNEKGEENVDIGRIICVKEDGTYNNVIGKEWFNLREDNRDPSEGLQFDGDGNLYYAIDGAVYKYNPKTNVNKKITAKTENTYYTKMQISDDGEWLFVQGCRYDQDTMRSVNFLRAIPTSDPTKAVYLFYKSDWNGPSNWIYHNESVYIATSSSLKRHDKKKGTYSVSDYELIFGSENNDTTTTPDNSNYWYYGSDIFEYMSSSTYDAKVKELVKDIRGCEVVDASEGWHTTFPNDNTCYKYVYKDFTLLDDDGNVDASALLDAFLFSLTAIKGGTISSLSEKYDIRFDKFADIKGFELLAEVSKGKKNANALKAVLSSQDAIKILETAVTNYTGSRYSYDNSISYYRNNFLADITYIKDTDTLLDKDAPSFFSKNSSGKYYTSSNCIEFLYIDYTNSTTRTICDWKNDYRKSDGSVDAQKVLEKFFSVCNKEGEKEFRLTAFKDDKTYGALYHKSLTDEDAIEFIAKDNKKMELLYKYLNEHYSYGFVAKTCFLKDTNKPAYIGDMYGNSGIQIHSFAAANYGSLYGISQKWEPNNKSVYKIVKLVDSDGESCEEWLDIDSTVQISGNSKIVAYGNGIYFKNPIIDDKGNELGAQKLLVFNLDSKRVSNLLRKMNGGSDNLEIISFNASKGYVYFSAVQGTDIINGMVDINTLDIKSIDSNSKFTNILSLK